MLLKTVDKTTEIKEIAQQLQQFAIKNNLPIKVVLDMYRKRITATQ